MKSKKFLIVCLASMALFVNGCSTDSNNDKKNTSVSSVVIQTKPVTLKVGQVTTISALVVPEDATNKNILWSSSDSNVVTIDSNGCITAKSVGKAEIKAIADGKEDKYTIEVIEAVKLSKITLSIANSKIKIGESNKLTLVVEPADASYVLTWTSSNPAVAEVDDNGNITAKSKGKTDIKVKSGDVETLISITVYDPNAPVYGYVEPTLTSVPTILKGETWLNHYKNDLKPFWTMEEAKGSPVGNFPTYRTGQGLVNTANTIRYPRMIARQIFQYSMGYLMTGDEELLKLAKAGVNWLIQHAKDTKNGGWYAQLDKDGNPKGTGPKYTQDTAYIAMAFGAYNFVARDKEIEKEMLGIRDLIFTKYWDSTKNKVMDGLDFTMTNPVDMDGNGGDLVAELDQVNGYMMLSQPIISDETRKKQMLDDMVLLCDTIKRIYWKDKVFFGSDINVGKYGTGHTDFGHTLKTYWMLLQLDKKLANAPNHEFLNANVDYMLTLAQKKNTQGWYENFTSSTTPDRWDASWWAFTECDQLSCTLDFQDQTNKYSAWLEKTGQTWMDKYVDKTYHEVYSGYGGGSKTNEWKNGFHSTEHALIMYIHGMYLEKKPLELYFAVPSEEKDTFVARPYLFNGDVTARDSQGKATIDGKTLEKVKVTFKNIY